MNPAGKRVRNAIMGTQKGGYEAVKAVTVSALRVDGGRELRTASDAEEDGVICAAVVVYLSGAFGG